MQKGGFQKIEDDENSDQDEEHAHDQNHPLPSRETAVRSVRMTVLCAVCGVVALITAFIALAVVSLQNAHHDTDEESYANCMEGRKVLIISLDGFRAEYLSQISTPNIHTHFIKEGVSVKSMKPVFPSKTFPNHYSIVTGLYPPSHGIVANHFWDPTLQKKFDIQQEGYDSEGTWFQGEPIWNTIKQKNLTSAALQFPATAANCGGRTLDGTDLSGYPAYYRPNYDRNWNISDRINLTIHFLTSKEPIYDLVLLYIEKTDTYGHEFGPDAPEMVDAVQSVDGYIGELIEGMREHDLLDITDVILLSDHGMTNVEKYDPSTYLDDDSKIIVINESLFPFDSVIIRDWSPIMGVYLNQSNGVFSDVEDAVEAMRNAIVHNAEHCKLYRNGLIPYVTYNNMHDYNDRVPDFIVDSEVGYSIYVKNRTVPTNAGTHGYNNSAQDMQAIFMARGPSFKSGVVYDDYLENIHLYEMFCQLLCGVQPNPNNGTQGIYDQKLFVEDHSYW